MTTKDFCKNLAEVDNNLKFQKDRRNEFHTELSSTPNQPQEVLDCTTDLLSQRTNAESCNKTTPSNNTNRTDGKVDDITQFGSTEHIYPNGWLPVMESFKVKPGTIRRAIILGRDVIVTRSVNGEVSVLDAYCPHMGVHIGVGGRALQLDNQSCVQCPFHGWTFRAFDGQCIRIPYLKNNSKCGIPKQAKLGTWECAEVNNFIYIWHHIDGQPPNWFLTPSPELSSPDWVLAGRSCHKTNLEVRDMLENGADMNHFEEIHNDLFFFGGEFLKVQAFNHFQEYFRHHWSPDWQPIMSENGKMTHMAEMNLLSWISVFKTRVFDIEIRATQIGPACVSLHYDSSWYGKGILKMNAIPLGGRRTLYVQHIYTQKSLFNWLMARWVLYGEIMQLERDLFMWNHKKNIKNPIFVPEDKILKRFRMWYSQFYKRKRQVTIKDSEQKTGKESVIDCANKVNL